MSFDSTDNIASEDPAKKAAYEAYLQGFQSLLETAPFSLSKFAKDKLLGAVIKDLHEYHTTQCLAFKHIHQAIEFSSNSQNDLLLPSIPMLAVRLFKQHELSSIESEAIFKVLSSSGTSGQTPARILLDRDTSARQSKVLVNIMQTILGKQRLPMLVIDSESVARGRAGFSARTAGIQGLSFFGRKHTYALNEDMSPNWQAIEAFFAAHGKGPVLIFGFTFMIWQYLIKQAKQDKRQFAAEKALIIHSGGWKKLEAEKVDNATFKKACESMIAGSQVHNFYGMAEQVGSIFIECPLGHLHAPNMAEVLIRRPHNLSLAEHGETGIIEVLSALPSSYPGHAILTEDMGRILGEDDCPCGWKGKYFEVLGRIPKVEVRGCSDTHG
ncbi:acyl-protein synthetase [Brumicola blandensis]|uniref:Acyl-protein synthetase n=1 Tax=Brumicola blandensis TaxID=3075611 RepID=A0AAW8R315_9ALTE|nr:acyl-protein synthetase [Alteromonas sp. W409]MDT0582824.1 acyl-protein synthetase [Alteromonas sp. W409]